MILLVTTRRRLKKNQEPHALSAAADKEWGTFKFKSERPGHPLPSKVKHLRSYFLLNYCGRRAASPESHRTTRQSSK